MSLLNIAKGLRPDKSMILINIDEVVGDIKKFNDEMAEKVIDAVIRMKGTLATQVQDKTPVAMGNLKASIYDDPLEVEGNEITGTVSVHGTTYAEAVEFGVKGRTYKYNVEGVGDVVGIGAGMFRRTFDSDDDNKALEDILVKALQ